MEANLCKGQFAKASPGERPKRAARNWTVTPGGVYLITEVPAGSACPSPNILRKLPTKNRTDQENTVPGKGEVAGSLGLPKQCVRRLSSGLSKRYWKSKRWAPRLRSLLRNPLTGADATGAR
jgi:hypothetical protein